jgi:hypothetical protein
MRGRVRVTCVYAGSLLWATAGFSQDWSQWRVPERDGRAQGFVLPNVWPKALKRAWQVPVCAGYSSPVITGGSSRST